MRSFGVIFLAVQKSAARLTVSRPTKRTPLWSKLHGDWPKSPSHLAPMSRYQSCSPGMKTFLIVMLLQDLGPEVQLDGVAELRQVTAEDQKVRRRIMALISVTARTAFSTKRVLTFFG